MPRLRNLNAKEVIRILEDLGFEVTRVKGSHHRMAFSSDACTCFTTVPWHGSKPIPTGTLKTIYRQVAVCVEEDKLKSLFYTE